MKQHSDASSGGVVTATLWQLEEAQVFWEKKEQGLALSRLKQMIGSLEEQVRTRAVMAASSSRRKLHVLAGVIWKGCLLVYLCVSVYMSLFWPFDL